ncbi:MAG: hypothetical protein ACRDWG_10665 [Actinomycetes bacterium]
MLQLRRRSVVRWLGVLALVTAATAVSGTPAGAGRPTVERIDATDVGCAVTVDDALIEVDAALTVGGESQVEVFVSTPTEFFGPDFDQPADIVVGPDSVHAVIAMLRFPIDGDPEPAGDAVVDMTFTPNGEPEVIKEAGDAGENVRSRTTGTIQPLSVAGSVSVIGLTVTDLSGCTAQHIDLTTRQTNPDTVVGGNGGGWVHEAHCVVGQDEGSLGILVDRKEFIGGFDVVTDGGFAEGAIQSADWHPRVLSGTFDVTDQDGAPLGTATARIESGALLTESKQVDTLGPFRRMIRIRLFDASGELTMPDGSVRPLTCQLVESSGYAILHSPSGPKPANDLPENAQPLAPGERIEAKTGGAALDPEIGNQCADFGLNYTVWYTFTGTGADITLDTAGSDFDTVIDAYAVDPDGNPVGVGCADFTEDGDPIARLTLPTDQGVTYLIQVGGSGGQSGRLVLTRSP